MTGYDDGCAHCEEMMQPYLDHVLSDAEVRAAERHLDDCDTCRKRYRFEESLRVYVRLAHAEQMSPELKEKLAALRVPLDSALGAGVRPDDDDEAPWTGPAGERLQRRVELLREAHADRLAAGREVDLGLQVVERAGLADVRHAVRHRLDPARDL